MGLMEKANCQQAIREMTDLRHYLHEHPERSNQEHQTSDLLKGYCRDMNLEILETANTGFVAILDTGKPGKTLGLRTDLDALPLEEDEYNLKQEKKYVSKNPGVMHACGHDGHMSILVGAMKSLVNIKADLKGKIVFIFEEAEENNSGIQPMIDLLKESGLHFDAIYGNHVASFIETGKIVASPGPVMAGQRVFTFTIKGKSGHGSRPDQAVNPIFVGSQILNAWTNAWVNQVDVTKTVTLGIGQFHAGDAYNIIPSKASISGSMRFFDQEAGQKAFDILQEVAQNTAWAHKASVEVDGHPQSLLPVVANDEDLSQLARQAIQDQFGPEALVEENWFASESFGRYRELAPICFCLVGIQNDQVGSGSGHHTEAFDFDDGALTYGIKTMTQFAINFLTQ